MSKKVIAVDMGKILAIRVFAKQWLIKLGGQLNNWTYEAVAKLGHSIVRVHVSPPTVSSINDRNKRALTIGTQSVTFGLMRRVIDQFCHMPAFNITCADDFNNIYPVMHEAFPTLVHDNKPLTITSMITRDSAKNIFVWERHNVGVTTKAAWRMLLISINGVDVVGMSQAEQRAVAGPIVEDVCEIRAATEAKTSCLLAINDA